MVSWLTNTVGCGSESNKTLWHRLGRDSVTGNDDGITPGADADVSRAEGAVETESVEISDDTSEAKNAGPHLVPQLLSTPDYDDAVAEFYRTAINSTMAEMDPDYGALRRLPMPEGVSTISVQVAGTDTPSPQVEMSQVVEVEREDVVNGNLEKVHEIISTVAASHLETLMPAFWGHIDTAVSAVGNSVDLSGEGLTWDRILDMYEQIEWMPNDLGIVQPPVRRAGKEAQKVLDALPKPTAEQQERMQRIAEAKQEAYVSRRRRRRLRGEPD